MQYLPLSIEGNFAGKTVLLTGGLGFLGSCVLEQLLRRTEVRNCGHYTAVQMKASALSDSTR